LKWSLGQTMAALGARKVFDRPHGPVRNGKVPAGHQACLVVGGEGPVRRRLSVEEATERARTGQRPAFDTDGRPALVVRGFRLKRVFRYENTDGEPLPEARRSATWVRGRSPTGPNDPPPRCPGFLEALYTLSERG
jgi:hypothetical protein